MRETMDGRRLDLSESPPHPGFTDAIQSMRWGLLSMGGGRQSSDSPPTWFLQQMGWRQLTVGGLGSLISSTNLSTSNMERPSNYPEGMRSPLLVLLYNHPNR